MYLLIEEDGDVTEADELPDNVSWDCWPTVIRIALYAGPDYETFKLVEGGWAKITEKKV